MSTKSRIVHTLIDRGFLEEHTVREILEPAFWSVNVHDGPEAYERTLRRFTRHQRLLLAVQWYRSEVNNGGHWQFYVNHTCVVVRDAQDGLDLLALPEHVLILRESIARLGQAVPLGGDLVSRAQSVPDFDDLDERYYALDRRYDVEARMLRFIRLHPDEFTFEGLVEHFLP